MMLGRLASSRTATAGAVGVGGGLGIAGAALAAWFCGKVAELLIAIHYPGVVWGLTPEDLTFLATVAGASAVGGPVGGAGVAMGVGARHVGEGWRKPATVDESPVIDERPA